MVEEWRPSAFLRPEYGTRMDLLAGEYRYWRIRCGVVAGPDVDWDRWQWWRPAERRA